MGNTMKLFMLMIAAALLFTAGCSKLTKENYDKLKMGMEYTEVTALLGSPDNCSDTMGIKSCIWGTETKNISVNFLADKTVVFSSNGVK